jgi:hypothetical protein
MAGELNSLATDVKGQGEDDLNREATKKTILNRRSQSSQRSREQEYGLEAASYKSDFWVPHQRAVTPGEFRKRLEQEITEAAENLSSWRSPVSFLCLSLCLLRFLLFKSVLCFFLYLCALRDLFVQKSAFVALV